MQTKRTIGRHISLTVTLTFRAAARLARDNAKRHVNNFTNRSIVRREGKI